MFILVEEYKKSNGFIVKCEQIVKNNKEKQRKTPSP
jgi:hypothetical protein